jgi:hypothetical protein
MNAQSTLDTLRTWAQTAAGDIKRPLQNLECETSNPDEYRELVTAMHKAQSWLREKGKAAGLKCVTETATLSYMGYKFTVRYKAPKHIQQAATSIAAYHKTGQQRASQEHKVALYLLECTAAGIAVCTHDVLQYFRANPDLGGPVETGSSSRSMNSLHKDGCTIDGVLYRTARQYTVTNPATLHKAHYYFLLPATQTEAGQQRLF